jgi:hypothetical protein
MITRTDGGWVLMLCSLGVAAHQWFGWHYWDLRQQFSLLHHEGWATWLMAAGILAMIAIAIYNSNHVKTEPDKTCQ